MSGDALDLDKSCLHDMAWTGIDNDAAVREVEELRARVLSTADRVQREGLPNLAQQLRAATRDLGGDL